MNIYLACTVRGNRGAVHALRSLAESLGRGGHVVLTHHLLQDDVEGAEAALSAREVFERDMRWLTAADVLIADASGSSYGVGFEVGYLLGLSERTEKRVLVLYDEARREQISRLVTGNSHPNCTTYAYQDTESLLKAVEQFLMSLSAHTR